jgi:alpha-tubulin suppressor-like RCC1 family protein
VIPVPVRGAADVIAIAAGDHHSLALSSDGTVLTWGSNLHGQLGQGTRHVVEQRVALPVLRGATAIAAGANHSLALLDDGTVLAWGHGVQGKLGDSSTLTSEVPVPVPGLDHVTAIAAGWAHSLAITQDGAVWTWGRDLFQGPAATSGTLPGPTRVDGLGGAVAIAAGWGHSLVLLEDGQVWAWGFNDYGELGDGSTADPCTSCGLEAPSLPRGEPRPVLGLRDVAAIAAGEHHSLALRTDSTVWAWGRNVFGEVGAPGIPYTVWHSSPRQVVSLHDVTAIAAHGAHSLALLGGSDRRLPVSRFKP